MADNGKVLEDIALHCVEECVRQNVGLSGLVDLLGAYEFAVQQCADHGLPTEDDVMDLAARIEPSTRGRYRRTPVVFASGGHATTAELLPNAMDRLFDPPPDVVPEEFVRAFLAIHPFTDGNGRVAFVLLNWLKGTLAQPVPLPEYDW